MGARLLVGGSMKHARLLAVLTLVAALVTPMASANGAPGKPHTATTTDATGDVRFVTFRDGDTITGRGTAPRRTQGDVRTVRVEHTGSVVRVSLRYVELTRTGTDHQHVAQIKTPKREVVVAVAAKPGSWNGTASIFTSTGSRMKCALTWKLDYQANTALIVVPRTCLGNPTWIRAGAGMSNTAGQTRYGDDGLTAGTPGNGLRLGPQLFR